MQSTRVSLWLQRKCFSVINLWRFCNLICTLLSRNKYISFQVQDWQNSHCTWHNPFVCDFYDSTQSHFSFNVASSSVIECILCRQNVTYEFSLVATFYPKIRLTVQPQQKYKYCNVFCCFFSIEGYQNHRGINVHICANIFNKCCLSGTEHKTTDAPRPNIWLTFYGPH